MDKYLYNFLIGLRDSPSVKESWQQNLEDSDLYDLIKFAKERGLIKGLDASQDAYGSVSLSLAIPRVTLEGKAFIESVKSQQ